MENKKRGQSALEFIIIFAAITFFFIIFMAAVQKNIERENKQKDTRLIQQVALDVKDEINLAAESSEGYSRNFTTPLNILGKQYEINLTSGRIYVSMENLGVSYKITNVTGSIKKGENQIRKLNETVFLNI